MYIGYKIVRFVKTIYVYIFIDLSLLRQIICLQIYVLLDIHKLFNANAYLCIFGSWQNLLTDEYIQERQIMAYLNAT